MIIVGIVTMSRNNEPTNRMAKVPRSDFLKPHFFKMVEATLENNINIMSGKVVKIPKLLFETSSLLAKSPSIRGSVVIGVRNINPIKITRTSIPLAPKVPFFQFKTFSL
jgi:hypothetical protein